MRYSLLYYLATILLAFFIVEFVIGIEVFVNYQNNTSESYIFVILSFVFNLLFLLCSLFVLLKYLKKLQTDKFNRVNNLFFDILQISGVSVFLLNDENQIIWTNSSLFLEEDKIINKNAITLFPKLSTLFFSKNNNMIEITHNLSDYSVYFFKEFGVLVFRDITEIKKLKDTYHSDSIVVGLLRIDNYEYININLLEKIKNLIPSKIFLTINKWATDNDILVKEYEPYHYFLVMKHASFQKIKKEKFEILSLIKNNTKDTGMMLTLSIGFAYNHNEPVKLFDIANKALALATSRGGDQIVISKFGESNNEVFGGKTDIILYSKADKIKSFGNRIIHELKEANNVVICGHKWGDYDCIGSAWGLYHFIKSKSPNPNLDINIVINLDLLDENARSKLMKIIPPKYKKLYITPQQVLKPTLLKKNTLVIINDTHVKTRIEEPEILNKKHKVIVLDHHRLSDSEFINVSQNLSFIDPKISSTSEIVTELINQFIPFDKEMPEFIANLLLTGIVLDSNHYKKRTTSRTLEMSAFLRTKGAKVDVVEEFLKEDVDVFKIKQAIVSNLLVLKSRFAISTAEENERIPRSILAQIAQEMCDLEGIDAAFVFGYDLKGQSAMSARSNDTINVQLIAEEMGGGGHFSAAAAQSLTEGINEFKNRLILILKNKY
ncbi:DHH family phosphoesterase [Mycoplasma sp. SG1]|uniref:DHH family phosphoesterase n=1 Tax=Mycoplasma sp. SG1 TaxID=2810348 RepID=UPI002023C19B|nr:DHH family phosphoesterase [Mycoplasma sp. SG1]URM52865.1 DHH family phosphoesterase [Mycoplasma sp. SG1]